MRWFFHIVISASTAMAQPLVNIDTVLVGDAGNSAWIGDSGRIYGSVGYDYRIGKHEVTIAEYCAFLNAVASTNTNSYIINLWHPNMATDLNVAGISRSGDGSAGNPYSYSVIGPSGITPPGADSPGNRPITYVSWFDAARFANWLHNGAVTDASTETGAYALNGSTNGAMPQHEPDAIWRLPTLDEWFKAGHYKGGGINSGYWHFAFQSEAQTPGSNAIGSSPYQANQIFFQERDFTGEYKGIICVTQAAFSVGNAFGFVYTNGLEPNQNYLTAVGAFSGSASAYGTFDQAGNVSEWVDTNNAVGPWYGPPTAMGGSWRDDNMGPTHYRLPIDEKSSRIGFRVAQVAVIPTKLISVEQPAGITITSGNGSTSFAATLVDSVSASTVYTIRNIGTASLTNIVIAKEGAHVSDFDVAVPTTNVLAPAAITTFSVSFAPIDGGSRSAAIRISSDATNDNPFTVHLTGFGLSETNDSDGDGLNDAAEFMMSALGFDWEVAQPSLVNALYSNAHLAKLFNEEQYNGNRVTGQADVISNPAGFDLFTADQYHARYSNGLSVGIGIVISNPTNYGLYDSQSIMDLRMGGAMMQKEGDTATVVFQPQTTTDIANHPFTNNGTPVTNVIPMPGNKGFLRIQAKTE
jgi:sulfatase modifying factor 1